MPRHPWVLALCAGAVCSSTLPRHHTSRPGTLWHRLHSGALGVRPNKIPLRRDYQVFGIF
eukprot:181324-Chlamydomonas_euryale.AAC.1